MKVLKKTLNYGSPKVHQNGLIIGHDLNWGGVAFRAVGEMLSEFWISADNVWAGPKNVGTMLYEHDTLLIDKKNEVFMTVQS